MSAGTTAAPDVSVIVPCYNRARLIGETLSSLTAQSHSAWECVVVDDGSSDDSARVVGRHVSADGRFRFVERQRGPKGGSACRNIGLAAAGGEYVVFLDSDDILAAHCLAQRVAFMRDHGLPDFAVFSGEEFGGPRDEAPRSLNRKPADTGHDTYLHMLLGMSAPWHTSGPIYRRSFLVELGGFDEHFERFQDVELAVRAVMRGRFEIVADAPVDHRVRRHTADGLKAEPAEFVAAVILSGERFVEVNHGLVRERFDGDERAAAQAALSGGLRKLVEVWIIGTARSTPYFRSCRAALKGHRMGLLSAGLTLRYLLRMSRWHAGRLRRRITAT